MIAAARSASPSARSAPAAASRPLMHLLAVELHADHAGRADGDLVLADAGDHRRGALHPGRLVEPAAAGGGVGVAGVRGDRAQRVEPAALLGDEHRRGEHARAREARGARASRARRRRSGRRPCRRSGLSPPATPGGAEARRQPALGTLADVLGPLDPARAEEAVAHSSPVGLVEAEHQVQVLHGLRRRALPEVVDRGEDEDPAGRARRGATWMRQTLVSRTSRTPGGRAASSTNGSSA